MIWDSDLEGPHYEIAADESSSLCVRAGPGTGKTFALMRRITRLLETGIPPEKILAISFTRTAAKDLKFKIQELGVPGYDDVEARTLHSLAFTILNDDIVFDTISRKARPMMDYEIRRLIEDLKDEHGGVKKVKKLLKAFEADWATLQNLNPGWPKDEHQMKFKTDLDRWLKIHECMLIGEVIPLTYHYLKFNPSSKYISFYEHVLVDEYQDLNRADQELILTLAQNKNIVVIGDENQSIYSFRYAHPEGILNFKDNRPDTIQKKLNVCKRCPKIVLKIANSLIANNRDVNIELNAYSSNVDGDVMLVYNESSEQEINNICLFVQKYIEKNSMVNPGEILILTPRSKIGNSIRDHLNHLQITAQSFFNEDCLKNQSAQIGFCLLTLMVNPDDKVSLRTWLSFDSSSYNYKQYQKILNGSIKKQIDIFTYFEGIIEGKFERPSRCKNIIKRYIEYKQKLNLLQNKDGKELIDALWSNDDLDCSEIRRYAESALMISNEPGKILNELRQLITQPEIPDENDGIVRIMSFHKSKGLTAKCVIISCLVEGLMPSSPNDELTAIGQLNEKYEQRRLFYVALTRTTETLLLSTFATMDKSDAYSMGARVNTTTGQRVTLLSSTFLSDLGDLTGIQEFKGREFTELMKK